jgi:hypothetical protein
LESFSFLEPELVAIRQIYDHLRSSNKPTSVHQQAATAAVAARATASTTNSTEHQH